MDDVAYEGEHGDAAVLNLGLAEPTDGALRAPAVEVGLGKVHGVVELYDGVGLLGEGLEVGN